MNHSIRVLLIGMVPAVFGCGNSETLPQFQRNVTPEVAHADSMRSLINTLHDQLKTEGIAGLKSGLMTLEERLEQFHSSEVGETNRSKYEEIEAILKELAKTVEDGRPTKAALDERIQEALSLADGLPKGDAQATASGSSGG